MYKEDSFFTLTPPGQAGLAALSLALGIALILVVYRLRLRWPLHILAAILALWVFVWLSPQVYYTYYMLLIDGLPVQLVVRTPPSFPEMLHLYTFTGPRNLSAHAQGFLGWCLFLIPAIKRLRRNAAN